MEHSVCLNCCHNRGGGHHGHHSKSFVELYFILSWASFIRCRKPLFIKFLVTACHLDWGTIMLPLTFEDLWYKWMFHLWECCIMNWDKIHAWRNVSAVFVLTVRGCTRSVYVCRWEYVIPKLVRPWATEQGHRHDLQACCWLHFWKNVVLYGSLQNSKGFLNCPKNLTVLGIRCMVSPMFLFKVFAWTWLLWKQVLRGNFWKNFVQACSSGTISLL